MKTTLEISTPLFKQIKKFAKDHDLTFRSVTEMALQKLLEGQKKSQKKFKLIKCSFKGKGLFEALQEGDWSQIREKIYQGRGG